MKQAIGIEKLLAWTYREELPKAGAARSLSGVGIGRAHRAVEKYGRYLSLIDCDGENRFGVVSDLMAMEEPHPDAVRVYEAVLALEGVEIDMPEGWNPLSDMAAIGDELPAILGKAMAGLIRTNCALLVRRHAIMGGAPAWEAEMPVRRVVTQQGVPLWFRRITVETSAGPVETEVNGFDRKGRRPMPGAYRKTYLDPDPTEAAIGRAEYEAWHAALAHLVGVLAGTLDAYELLPTERPARPWEEGTAEPARILPAREQVAPVSGAKNGKRRAA